MKNPNFLYVTNGSRLAPGEQTLKFEDRTHYLKHWNQLPEGYNLTDVGLCGMEFSRVSMNVEIPYLEFVYILTRLRAPGRRELKPDELQSVFPVVAFAGNNKVYLRLGNVEYTQDEVRNLVDQGIFIDIYEDFWLTRNSNAVE
ncbi:hypothetical protein [Pseudomonas phage vB_PseuGesM_254]|uniref:Uncharacterized protein n=1 Tax=Pseudomonas phage vB_PseuGesM_254 TaxID=3092638 RepID=A0AAX4G6D4_9CAUD|nr:hypothetical protein [Pseudomonas phage PseuGes_254]